jgi:hypothetical protein
MCVEGGGGAADEHRIGHQSLQLRGGPQHIVETGLLDHGSSLSLAIIPPRTDVAFGSCGIYGWRHA